MPDANPTTLTPQLMMKRPTLEDLPPLDLPAGVTVRTYQPGDAAAWDAINAAAFGWDPDQPHFMQKMRRDSGFRPERIFFVCVDGKPAATTSAWHNPEYGPASGTVHWVGVLPEHAGKRLGYWASLAALHQMKREGRSFAVLRTDDFRVPAIRTYLRLGFGPLIIGDNQPDRWRTTFEQIGKPELAETFARELAQPPAVFSLGREDLSKPDRYEPRQRWSPHRPDPGGGVGGGDVTFLGDESLYQPSQVGRLDVTPARVTVDEPVTGPVEVRFTVGRRGLRAGERVTVSIRGQSPLGFARRKEDPIEILLPEGVEGDRCGGGALGVSITSGELQAGQAITWRIHPAADARWHRVARERRLYAVVHPGGGEPQLRPASHATIDIQPGPAACLEVTVPMSRRPTEQDAALPVRVTSRDAWDNRTPIDGVIALNVAGADAPMQAVLAGGLATVDLPVPPTGDQATRALRVTARLGQVLSPTAGVSLPEATSNPAAPSADLVACIGDLHCHDMFSEAEGTPDEVYRFARDDRGLDFFSLAVQSHGGHGNAKWAIHKEAADRFLDEGRFVSLLAYEWQHSAFGDKVIHYLGGDQPYLPMDNSAYAAPQKLYEALRQSDAFIIPHHVGYPTPRWVPGTDWTVVDDQVERLVELWSMHGSSEGWDASDRPLRDTDPEHAAMAALRRGLRLGFVGGSDSHAARPGGSAQEVLGHWGGLAGVWAPERTREGIFFALRDRHTWALTRARIVLKMTVNDALMGSEIPAADVARVHADVWAPGAIDRVELVKNTRLLHTWKLDGADAASLDFEDQTEGPAFYHVRVTQTDGELAVGSPVWVG